MFNNLTNLTLIEDMTRDYEAYKTKHSMWISVESLWKKWLRS